MSPQTHAEVEAESVDRNALLLMLSYVEAECRRIGATDAARHAALAASLVPAETDIAPETVRPRSACLH